MNAIVNFVGYLVGNDPWSFYTDSYTNNSDCKNKLDCRGNRNIWPKHDLFHFMFYI